MFAEVSNGGCGGASSRSIGIVVVVIVAVAVVVGGGSRRSYSLLHVRVVATVGERPGARQRAEGGGKNRQ